MEGPGTITWENFVHDAEMIVQLSDEISDDWKLVGDKVFLTYQTFKSIKSTLNTKILRKNRLSPLIQFVRHRKPPSCDVGATPSCDLQFRVNLSLLKSNFSKTT